MGSVEAGFFFKRRLGAEGDDFVEEGEGGGRLVGEEKADGGEVLGLRGGIGKGVEGGGGGGVLAGGIESDGLFEGRGRLIVGGSAEEGSGVGWGLDGGELPRGWLGPGEIGDGKGSGGGEEPRPSVRFGGGFREDVKDGLESLDGLEGGEAGFAGEVMKLEGIAGAFVEFFGEVAFDDVF